MNKRNDWKGFLDLANSDLKRYGWEIRLTDYYHDGCYTCEFYNTDDGISKMVYAENYYEDELSDLVHDAWTYALGNLCNRK